MPAARTSPVKAIGPVALGLAMLLASACGRDIGDECQTSVDCDPNGTRACDLSQPGGYCTVLGCDEQIERLAREFHRAQDFLYLGRGINFPIALEGALKLKEISYIHAEGYPAGEMKHGPNALIDEELPVVVIATRDETSEASKLRYEKTVSNMVEVKARDGVVIAIVSEGDEEARQIADRVIEIPKASDLLSPILAIVPLQLLAYHIGVRRGCDVDQPRNLAKSVTVE